MKPERRLALEKNRHAIDYYDVLREAIDQAEEALNAIDSALEDGVALSEALAAADAPSVRRQMTDAIAEYERRRHDSRLAMMLLGLSEGMTKSDIARAWGISPQWAGQEVEAARRMLKSLPEQMESP